MAMCKELRNYLNENYEGIVILDDPSFDYSVVGVSDDMQHLIYDFEKMVEEYMQDEECDYEDAVEFIEYNTCRAISYMGEFQPVIFRNIEVL